MNGVALVRDDIDGLYDRCGEIDEDALGVVLLELVTEAICVAIGVAEKVGIGVSEGNKVAILERDTAVDDDILAETDVLDVDDELATTVRVTDGVICNDKESSGVALTLSDTLDDEDAEGATDNEAIVVEVIDTSGDNEVYADAEADCA